VAARNEPLPKGSDEFVEAFAKGLSVISAFKDGQDALTITEVASRASLPRAGARRLLLTLVNLGYATQREGHFSLTPRVLRLGFAYLSSLSLREVAQPLIDDLSKQVNERAAVSVLDGDEIVYIARATWARFLWRQLTVGSRLPAYCTSSGRVLLAAKASIERDIYLANVELIPFTKHTICNRNALQAELARVDKQGWAAVFNELELGVCAMAAPIRDSSGTVVAALNISGSLSRFTKASYLETCLSPLLETAGEISARLFVS
jgi:IclR family transcriptional regulator, pca regulon regulatory protein